MTCLTCGGEARVVPSSRARFCSVACYRKHTGETEPESNVRRCLDRLGLSFIQECAIRGWQGPVDFVIPSGNIALEVDEPYWHDRVKDRDTRKNLFLQSRGYTVIRLLATPFYGPLTDDMLSAISAALSVADHVIATTNTAGLHPLQLALPFDQKWVIGG